MSAHFVDTPAAGSRRPATPGRSETAQSSLLGQGTLSWTLVQQCHADGILIFEYATKFRLNGRLLADRSGERLLDTHHIRVDGSRGLR